MISGTFLPEQSLGVWGGKAGVGAAPSGVQWPPLLSGLSCPWLGWRQLGRLVPYMAPYVAPV